MVGFAILVGVAAFVVGLTLALPWLIAEFFPYKSLTAQRVGKPDVRTESYKGRTALITGANGAFGSRAAKIFAHRDVDTLVLVDVMDLKGVKEQIETELAEKGKPIPKILLWQIDMMSFAGCQELGRKAKELKSLDHALLTAGILAFTRRESPEGWESSVQVNYLSSALIGLLLLPVLKASAGNPNPPVLTFVTTFGIYPSSFTMYRPFTGTYLRKMSNCMELMQAHQYGRSKCLLLYFSRELAARVSAVAAAGKATRNITVNSADPGSAWTGLTGPNQAKLLPRLIMNMGARDPQICATALVNGVSVAGDDHGKIMQDFDTASYPPFMCRKSGLATQQQLWEETKAEFVSKVPEVNAVYEMLGN